MFVLASEAPNGNFLPGDMNEFYWGTAAFLIIFGLFVWKGVPLIAKAMKGKTERIENEIANAEMARANAESELATLSTQLGDSDAASQSIIADARAQADRLKSDLMARAEADIVEFRQRAEIDIRASKDQALSDLRAEVARRASVAADAVVRNNLDGNTQSELIDSYIAQVSGSTS